MLCCNLIIECLTKYPCDKIYSKNFIGNRFSFKVFYYLCKQISNSL